MQSTTEALVRWCGRLASIVHTHDFYTNVFGMVVVHRSCSCTFSIDERNGGNAAKTETVQKVAYSLAHHIVANSKAVENKLVADGIGPDKVSVIYNGLDLNRLETSLTVRR